MCLPAHIELSPLPFGNHRRYRLYWTEAALFLAFTLLIAAYHWYGLMGMASESTIEF